MLIRGGVAFLNEIHSLMKLPKLLVQVSLVIFFYSHTMAGPKSGFFLPDSIAELTIKFRSIKNLIILPVRINDSVVVNLILDTGCRNLVLFGQSFKKLLNISSDKEIMFSGLGAGNPVKGNLSLNNDVKIASVHGQQVPIIVVPDKNLFSLYRDIDGLIGYEVFLRFEIEINSVDQTITFRPALRASPPEDFELVALKIVDSRPVMESSIIFDKKNKAACDLMIDTGSSIGLLLKTTDLTQFKDFFEEKVIGRGLNGPLYGYETRTERLRLGNFEMNYLQANIVESEWHNYASIGMEIMKNYIVVLNYCKSYACFRKIA
jgi:hypothetical protein